MKDYIYEYKHGGKLIAFQSRSDDLIIDDIDEDGNHSAVIISRESLLGFFEWLNGNIKVPGVPND